MKHDQVKIHCLSCWCDDVCVIFKHYIVWFYDAIDIAGIIKQCIHQSIFIWVDWLPYLFEVKWEKKILPISSNTAYFIWKCIFTPNNREFLSVNFVDQRICVKDSETSMICIHSPIRSVIDSLGASLDCIVDGLYTIWIYSKRVQIECEKTCKGQQKHGIFTNESNEPSNEK